MLADPNPHPTWRWPIQSCTVSSKQLEDLLCLLRKLPDYRKPKGLRHPYCSILTISIAALLAGAKSYIAISEFAGKLCQNQLKRLRARRDKTTGVFMPPSETTLRRVLQSADVDAVELHLGNWLMQTAQDKTIDLDGKTLKGARRENGTKVHLLSAFLHQQAITVGQLEVGEKINEIPMVTKLLDPLDIEGAVVTADAMHTQVATASYIVEKNTQTISLLSKRIKKISLKLSLCSKTPLFPPPHQTVDKGHGRIEVRTLRASTFLNGYLRHGPAINNRKPLNFRRFKHS